MQAFPTAIRSGLTSWEVADGIVVLSSGPGTAGTSNSTLLLDGDTAAVVDTLLVPSMAAGVLDELRRRGARATLVLNTHPHADHVGGNAAFVASALAAHPVTADSVRRLAADPSLLAGLFPAHADELGGLSLAVPDPVEPAGLTLPLAAEVLATGPAHTPVDLAVLLPDRGVLVAGDLCFNQVTPLALPGHAHLAGWADALDRLAAVAPRVVVPGHGPPGGVEILDAVRSWLRAVLAIAAEAIETGADARTLAAMVDAGPVAGWAEPGRTALALAVAVAELTGDTSGLPGGVPVASRAAVTATPARSPGRGVGEQE
jgi:cyclase